MHYTDSKTWTKQVVLSIQIQVIIIAIIIAIIIVITTTIIKFRLHATNGFQNVTLGVVQRRLC